MSLEVGVVNCIPLDQNDWHERAAQAPCGDFVRFVAETRFNGSLLNAWNFFRTEAEFIKRKLDAFEKRGAIVSLRANVDDIRGIAANHKNVVVIAHWKNSIISNETFQGNQLEVWNAMLSAEDFSELFPKTFDGTVLMVVCTSNLLAETFRRQHRNAICICNRNLMRPGLAMMKLDAVLALMTAKGVPMWRALQNVGEIIDSVA